MSKRADTIRSLFAAPQAEALSADNNASRVSSGSVRSLRESFSGVERENDDLRQKLASGAMVVEVDPGLVDPSPVADRFAGDDDASFEALKASIRQRGQEVPVLLREHPLSPGRYQSAYGHRRVRAARELGQPVKAIIRELTDTDLVISQGIENSAREDLSFIERATFAMRLEDAGHDRLVIQEALSIDRAETSKLLSVARSIPSDVIVAIGKAPKVGRGRWQALSDALKAPGALKRAQTALKRPEFQERASDERFLAVLAAAPASHKSRPADVKETVVSRSGQHVARIQRVGRDLKIVMERDVDAEFATFLVEQLPDLFESYLESRPSKDRSEA